MYQNSSETQICMHKTTQPQPTSPRNHTDLHETIYQKQSKSTHIVSQI